MNQGKTLLIGIFVVAAGIIGSWMLMFLKPTIGDNAKTLIVYFTDVDKINPGTRVTFAGFPVGEVIQVRRMDENRRLQTADEGRLYFYELTLKVDSSVKIYNTDLVTARTSGLLGEKSIAIIPRKIQEGVPLVEITEKPLFAESPGTVEDALSEFDVIADKAKVLIDEVTGLVTDNRSNVTEAISNLKDTLAEAKVMAKTATERDLVGSLDTALEKTGKAMNTLDQQLAKLSEEKILDNLGVISKNLNDITTAVNRPELLEGIVEHAHSITVGVDELQARISDSWDHVDKSLEDFKDAIASAKDFTNKGSAIADQIHEIVSHVNQGEGTMGKLLKSDETYLQVNRLMNKLDTLMNDVNHYGLLFHLDKGWQRQRVKRANRLQDLATAQQFQDYFDEEMDQISTSLARVNILMREAEHEDREFMQEKQFSKVFADLIRQVKSLEKTLQYYNQTMMEESPN